MCFIPSLRWEIRVGIEYRMKVHYESIKAPITEDMEDRSCLTLDKKKQSNEIIKYS